MRSVFSARKQRLCDRWFESELRPFLAQHHQLAIISQKTQDRRSCAKAVIGALERRLQAVNRYLTKPAACREKLQRHCGKVIASWSVLKANPFFLTRKIAKMHQAIIDIAAQRIAAALSDSDNADPASIFSETLTQMIAEP